MLETQSISTKEDFYSFHVFLFPFEWQDEDVPQKATLEEKNQLKIVLDLMGNAGHWQRRASWNKPTSVVQYNEANYFYDFVRPVLYDTNDSRTLQAHYYHKMPQSPTEYVITLNNGKTYRLEVDDIVVSFYKMGVGLMAFHLYNRRQDQSSPADILTINQYGRRLYPPYLGAPMDQLGKQAFFDYDDWGASLAGPKDGKQIPESIQIETKGKVWVKEEYLTYHQSPDLEQEPGLIQQLLPRPLTNRFKLNPVLDDRMFVLCWYGNKRMAGRLEKTFQSDKWWHQFIFVDAGDFHSTENKTMFEQQLKDHTYPRWTDSKTFYGASRYSFMCVTETFSENWFARVLCYHIQTVYYKVTLLCLVQRACLMRFSAEVTEISQMKANERQLGRKVSSLYKQYLRFVNRIYFREVTAQEQGIELYDLLQKRMRLSDHVKDLEGEIQELHNYVSMLEEENRNDKLDLLTYIGAFFVVPSFIATYLALFGGLKKGDILYYGILSLTSSVIAYLIIRTKGVARWIFIILLAALLLFITFYSPVQIVNNG